MQFNNPKTKKKEPIKQHRLHPYHKVVQVAQNRKTTRTTLNTTLSQEYLDYVEKILQLKDIEKDIGSKKAVNFTLAFRIIQDINTNTEELRLVKAIIIEAHKHWNYLKGMKN